MVISECLTLTRQAGEEIRTLSYLLHPPLLDELGLASALEWYAQGFESRTGIRVRVDIPREFPRLPPDVEMTLFRIVQESLTNVHRYSGSSTRQLRVPKFRARTPRARSQQWRSKIPAKGDGSSRRKSAARDSSKSGSGNSRNARAHEATLWAIGDHVPAE